jgi:hypothetical protein
VFGDVGAAAGAVGWVPGFEPEQAVLAECGEAEAPDEPVGFAYRLLLFGGEGGEVGGDLEGGAVADAGPPIGV